MIRVPFMVQPVLLPVLRTCVNGRSLLQLPKMNRCFGSQWTACPSSHSIRRRPRWRSMATTCAVSPSTKQQLYMWATNSGDSSSGSQGQDADEPALIEEWRPLLLVNSDGGNDDDTDWCMESVVCGPTDIAIVTNDGRCFVFGANQHGQLGLGHTNAVTLPTELTLTINHNHDNDATTKRHNDSISAIALGSNFGAIVSSSGDLYTAGSGGSPTTGLGMLGHGDASSRLRPTRVESLVRDDCTVQRKPWRVKRT
jgi:Regulator of chromosome condensation (RCC1) repeat